MQRSEERKLPFVSVIICTYNRKKFLKDCLDSIFKMDYPKSSYEIVVVDGGSTDGTEQLCKQFPKIRFVVERKHGLAYARNKGAGLAQGAIIAYTDDDCIVDKNWLKKLVEGFQFSNSVVGVGGPVHPLNPEIIPSKICVKAALGLYDNGEKIKPVSHILTSNAAFKKELFKTIKFDETLGVTRKGKFIFSGEDTAFCQAIINSGNKLIYTPHAKVYHNIPKGRVTVAYIIKRAIHGGIIQARMFIYKKQSRIWAIRYAVGQLAQYILKTPSDISFSSCYYIVHFASALFASLTGLDKVI